MRPTTISFFRTNGAIVSISVLVGCLVPAFSAQSFVFPETDKDATDTVTLERGSSLFRKPFSVSEGLGPDFNAPSCSSCHDAPMVGGSGIRRDQFVEWTYGGHSDALGAPRQRFTVTSSGAITTISPATRHRRRPPALFGLAYLEAIQVEDLRSRSDPFDSDRDGISGRLPSRDGCVGRFGWQSSVCDIHSFVTGALSRELGIESLPRRRSEISESDLQDLVAYVRGLAPPRAAQSHDGADLFDRALCSKCHTPVTGTANIHGNRFEVTAYTDFLVHEMGNRPRHNEEDARTEFRTAPLWSINSTGPPYLHDGSAATLEQAILRHRGEGERSRRIFAAFSRADQQRLLRFVRSR